MWALAKSDFLLNPSEEFYCLLFILCSNLVLFIKRFKNVHFEVKRKHKNLKFDIVTF